MTQAEQVGAVPIHYHCPEECSHLQPFSLAGTLMCGRCHFVLGVATEMVACNPETCPDDVGAA